MDNLRQIFAALREKLFGSYERVVDFTEWIEERDIRQSRVTAALGYLCFVIPLVFHDDKQFARFHCNQSILLLLLSTVVTVVWGLIPLVGPLLIVLQELFCIAFAVRGFILALHGEAKSVPFVGWITVLAYRYPGQ